MEGISVANRPRISHVKGYLGTFGCIAKGSLPRIFVFVGSFSLEEKYVWLSELEQKRIIYFYYIIEPTHVTRCTQPTFHISTIVVQNLYRISGLHESVEMCCEPSLKVCDEDGFE